MGVGSKSPPKTWRIRIHEDATTLQYEDGKGEDGDWMASREESSVVQQGAPETHGLCVLLSVMLCQMMLQIISKHKHSSCVLTSYRITYMGAVLMSTGPAKPAPEVKGRNILTV